MSLKNAANGRLRFHKHFSNFQSHLAKENVLFRSIRDQEDG